MVGKVLGIRELEQFSSRRSSVYVDPDCEKFFELPLFIAASSNDITTKCQCWQLSPGNKPHPPPVPHLRSDTLEAQTASNTKTNMHNNK